MGLTKVKIYPGLIGSDVHDAENGDIQIQQIPIKKLVLNEPHKTGSFFEKGEAKNVVDNIEKSLDKVPPILVMISPYDDTKYIVLDGHHRIYAFKKASKDMISAKVIGDDSVYLSPNEYGDKNKKPISLLNFKKEDNSFDMDSQRPELNNHSLSEYFAKNNINETEKQFSPPPHETETYNKIMGTKHSKHNPYDNEDDKDDVFPTESSDWRKKKEVREQGADSSGGFEAPFGASGGDFTVLKRDIHKFKGLPNTKKYDVNEKEKLDEQMTADVSAGASYDVPAFGKTPKGGRKNPLAIDGPKSIAKSRAVTDPNFPKWGGPGGVFIKIKEKCKKFPYCNQGDINAIEPLREAISKAAEKYGIPRHDVEKIVINEINKIFINYEGERTR